MKISYKTFVEKNPRSDLDVLIKVLAPPRRSVNVFMGGAMFSDILDGMSNVGDNKSMWISKKDYEEHGFRIVLKKVCNNLQCK